jgi:hypothetical protein
MRQSQVIGPRATHLESEFDFQSLRKIGYAIPLFCFIGSLVITVDLIFHEQAMLNLLLAESDDNESSLAPHPMTSEDSDFEFNWTICIFALPCLIAIWSHIKYILHVAHEGTVILKIKCDDREQPTG